MSYRDQWKMIHLLNTCSKGELTAADLEKMSVNCKVDTIYMLLDSKIVECNDRENGPYWLNPVARQILNQFIVCRGDRDKTIMYVDQPVCFVIMPFSEKWSANVYDKIIKPAVEGADLTCIRGDEIERTGTLNGNIFKTLQRAGLVVADITAPNPNVYYELGVADTLGKESFVIYQVGNEKKIAADKEGIHYYAYDPKVPGKAKKELCLALKAWNKDQNLKNTARYCKI